MKTRCPACNATSSLDAIIGHDQDAQALIAFGKLHPDLAEPMIRYLAMFRSSNRDLSFARVAKLLEPLQQDIERRSIRRNGADCPAPVEAWLYAIDQAIKQRDAEVLKLPLSSHGWLYAVIAAYKPSNAPAPQSPTSGRAPRKTLRGVAPEDMNAHLRKHWKPGETTDETYERLLKAQGES